MNKKNAWTPDDEKEHFPSMMEWWCAEGFFKTIEDNKKWHFKTSFSEWLRFKGNPGSNYLLDHFDIENKKHYIYHINNEEEKLKISKDKLEVWFNNSKLEGLYPNYKLHLENPNDDINLDISLKSEVLPRWLAQDATNGLLPSGMGFYRYGFIPKNQINGTMKIKDKIFDVDGKGYYEHVYGHFTYEKSLSNLLNIKKIASTYFNLAGWWIHNHKIKIPKTIAFTSENNPSGYDWVWAVLDNGWSLFFGNIMFWVKEGPIFGSLTLTKDENTTIEFCNANVTYKKVIYIKEHDFYYPSEILVDAKSNDERLKLLFKMDYNNIIEHITKFTLKNLGIGYVLVEAPGSVEGYCSDGKEKINLKGICKMEPQRSISKHGHNSVKFDFYLPPKQFGCSIDLNSHFLKKNLKFNFGIKPKLRFSIRSKKINLGEIPDSNAKRFIYYAQ